MKKSYWSAAVVLLVLGGAAIAFLSRPAEIHALVAERHELPAPEQARNIFASLHGNIYRAFDYSNESDIYDALSKSVAGHLLDKIYNEIYQSLIMREEGGAVSKVRSVKVLSSALLNQPPGPDELTFRIKATWEVSSSIRHITHTHDRTNQYEGIYTVGLIDGSWRIVEDRILRQRRTAEDWQPVTEGSGAVSMTGKAEPNS